MYIVFLKLKNALFMSYVLMYDSISNTCSVCKKNYMFDLIKHGKSTLSIIHAQIMWFVLIIFLKKFVSIFFINYTTNLGVQLIQI